MILYRIFKAILFIFIMLVWCILFAYSIQCRSYAIVFIPALAFATIEIFYHDSLFYTSEET